MRRVACLLLAALLCGAPALGGDYAAVTGPCDPVFPRDHGPHPDFRTEWWYFTGNLADASGRAFGFQLTFFRTRLAPPGSATGPENPSPWRTEQLYLAHAAVTDVSGESGTPFRFAERALRGARGLAGAEVGQNGTARIVCGGWSAAIGPEAIILEAADPGLGIHLTLLPEKPPVAHGERGYSRKGDNPASASCYVSFTRLAAGGTLTAGDREFAVTGTAWMDHEWSSSLLEPGVTGWDWFALQIADGSELMLFTLRKEDGTAVPVPAGTFVPPAGEPVALGPDAARIEVAERWASPRSGVAYPARWRIAVPGERLDLTVTPRVADQELDTAASTGVTYWEGAVTVEGTRGDAPVSGVGYVELTGYAGGFEAPL